MKPRHRKPSPAPSTPIPPHCDPCILHAPGVCQFCDLAPDWQQYRELARINFTGEYDTAKAPCPSVYFRAVDVRDAWPGNLPGGYPVDGQE